MAPCALVDPNIELSSSQLGSGLFSLLGITQLVERCPGMRVYHERACLVKTGGPRSPSSAPVVSSRRGSTSRRLTVRRLYRRPPSRESRQTAAAITVRDAVVEGESAAGRYQPLVRPRACSPAHGNIQIVGEGSR